MEIEGYLDSAEMAFGELYGDLRKVATQAERKFLEMMEEMQNLMGC